MTGSEFRVARHLMMLTQRHLAVLLDVSRPTVSYYENDRVKVPRTVELAIAALKHERAGQSDPGLSYRSRARRCKQRADRGPFPL